MLTKRYLTLVDWSKRLVRNTKAIEFENKIPDFTNLDTKEALSTKYTEIENGIRDTGFMYRFVVYGRLHILGCS